MATFLHRLGAFAARCRWIVLGVWAAVLVAVAGSAGHALDEADYTARAAEALTALDLPATGTG